MLATEAVTLDFTGCNLADADVLERILSHGGFSMPLPLQSLTLAACPFSPHLIDSIRTPFLTSLSLSRCETACIDDMDRAMISLATRISSITSLDLSMTQLSNTGAAFVLAHLAQLQYLDISSCSRLTSESAWTGHVASKQLTHLDLRGNRGLGSAILLALGSSHLAHDQPEYVADEKKKRLSLQTLVVTGTAIDLAGITCLQLDKLECLEIGECECSPHDFRQLVRGTPHLQVLDLSWCDALRDESIIHLTAGECNSSLTSLSLRCLEISDAAVCHFCHFSQLRCLVLSRCDSITDFGLEALCQGCTQLVTLDLSWLTDLSSHALLTFLPWLTKIETLSLEGLKPVADEHLLLFAACLTHLRTLTLTWCNGMTLCTFLIPLQFWP